MSQLEGSLRALYAKPLSSLPTIIDIGRLSKRINVVILGDNNETVDDGDSEENDKDITSVEQLDKSHAYYLSKIIKRVLIAVEPKETHEKLLLAVDEFEKDSLNQSDLQNYVRTLFSKFDDNCRTIKVFKLINQSALSSAIMAVKLNVAQQKSTLSQELRMTKDVRSMDGWKIHIVISPVDICISHERKEQGLGPPICPDYWDISWRYVS